MDSRTQSPPPISKTSSSESNGVLGTASPKGGKQQPPGRPALSSGAHASPAGAPGAPLHTPGSLPAVSPQAPPPVSEARGGFRARHRQAPTACGRESGGSSLGHGVPPDSSSEAPGKHPAVLQPRCPPAPPRPPPKVPRAGAVLGCPWGWQRAPRGRPRRPARGHVTGSSWWLAGPAGSCSSYPQPKSRVPRGRHKRKWPNLIIFPKLNT